MTGRILMAAAALAAAAPLFVATAQAADPSQPGVAPDTGQINPGHAPAPWSTAAPLPQDAQPAQEDARAALMMPDNGAPSAGQSPGQSTGQSTPQSSTGEAANPAANPGQSGSGDVTGSAGANAGAAAAPAGPIGATIQTMPAKFSKRNDVLDHMPIAAWPLPLNEEQRRQMYQAVMDDKSPAAADAAALKPAASLSAAQRHDMHPLPESLAAIDGLQGLQYVKGKDKVLLVRPSTGIVVDELAM
ncbi:MAG: hypothetical protein ACTHJS_04245 [Xanthobacteraceae bacterium]